MLAERRIFKRQEEVFFKQCKQRTENKAAIGVLCWETKTLCVRLVRVTAR